MANPPELRSTSPSGTDHRGLLAHLQSDCHMPTAQWWHQASYAFTQLCSVLYPRLTYPQPPPSLDVDSPFAAERERSLPKVRVLPVGTHRMRLVSTDEELECAAFGNIRPENYVDVFWESVVATRQGAASKLAVHRVDKAPVLRYLVTMEGFRFVITYHHCVELVDRYPQIIGAPVSFLHDTCSEDAAQAAYRIQKADDLNRRFDESDMYRRAFYYLRAWAITRGLMCPQKGDHPCLTGGLRLLDVFEKACLEDESCNLQGNPDDLFDNLLCQFFNHHRHCEEPPPPESAEHQAVCEYAPDIKDLNHSRALHEELSDIVSQLDSQHDGPQGLGKAYDWNALITNLKKTPFSRRMKPTVYVIVELWVNFSSVKEGGPWLSLIQSNLDNLKEDLQRAELDHPYVRIWPQRLIHPDVEPSCHNYEGYFVIGIQVDHHQRSQSIPIVTEVAEAWADHQNSSNPQYSAEAFVGVSVVEDVSTFETFVACPLEWPLGVISPEDAWRDHPTAEKPTQNSSLPTQLPQILSATTNTPPQTASQVHPTDTQTPKQRFREASDVINRIYHDPSYNLDEWAIGYFDRHCDHPVQISVSQWVSESTSYYFIPSHRILYFVKYDTDEKMRGRVMWDKKRRVDHVFGSGQIKAADGGKGLVGG